MTTSKWCRNRDVVVVVYAEKRGSRRRNVRGYNRRAELLDYAKHLRSPAPPPSHIKQTQVLGADGVRKQNSLSSPTCFNKWSFVVTRFLGCIRAPKTTKVKKKKNNKSNVKALVHSFQIKKRGSFVSKLLAALQKRR
ncbi:hypothetical protein SASPL_130520 [Salvia splendens]|uniref:Uncharacterized protein n=1 Tax=Salvia splendens TaxID=180675 RepID=A0A8X8X681_SALSN|nr:uncharacterized protein LOC121755034 [Salvia splendens]KAG6407528.1 hypothetical protein SASPL_130520 [Salvia splendens]